MANSIKDRLAQAIKDAMRAKDKPRLAALRLASAEFKRIEVDERIEIEDARAVAILDKMVKQRRDSINQYQQAGRQELAEQEAFEIEIIQEFLPEQLTNAELDQLIAEAIATTGAMSMQDMGKVMGILKSKVQGRADMGEVSKLIKSKLS
ncbi:GatB/YqeY domain-containing protein [Endozoicomonas sp. SM1973]|uniref:GatB/YqeY domain-containing protein n=1 Tax=Spartinivicinus marinus TaxID=2994442 RepID=A0A853I333_9GAMM|nr:GatB/YqeY domain-containing protein [Spartinivicinus marinus]MCX4028015.1 GatB/YqeY domain-containing protein [Spartinivicinus marinus]NYZ68360.1 GatB/YqeY domain-containing protein [Spartinivicinus marinus]